MKFSINRLIVCQVLVVCSWIMIFQMTIQKSIFKQQSDTSKLIIVNKPENRNLHEKEVIEEKKQHSVEILSDRLGVSVTSAESQKLAATPREYEPNETGSFANCTGFVDSQPSTTDNHIDQGEITVSCHKIHYRAPISKFHNTGPVIIGILSAAGGTGPDRRMSIRNTWASNQAGIFFLVAGPWDDIKDEYHKYNDLIWIDEEEVYDGERSVLTFKTHSFLTIVHNFSTILNNKYSYAFKTDDDCYVKVQALQERLLDISPDYWGWCPDKQYAPLRGPENKWSVSYKSYPEPMYPRYCQGAGFAVSQKFIECAVAGNNIAQARFMAFEDVSVGALAERCYVKPYHDRRPIKLYRVGNTEERNRVNFNQGTADDDAWLPKADMRFKIIQHRVHNDNDMRAFHQSVLEESGEDDSQEKEKDYVQKVFRNGYYYYYYYEETEN